MLEFEEMSSRLQEIEYCDVGCHENSCCCCLECCICRVADLDLQVIPQSVFLVEAVRFIVSSGGMGK